MNCLVDMGEKIATDFSKSQDFERFISDLGFDLDNGADLNLAYDTLEGAFNLLARTAREKISDLPLKQRLLRMAILEEQLTKARRTVIKKQLQQFSTPLTISEAVGAAADVRPGDTVLEPTAGTGNLIEPFYHNDGLVRLVNEIDPQRAAVLKMLGYNATELNVLGKEWVIGDDGKILGPLASVVVTNPPWGSYSTGKYGKAINTPVKLNDWSQRFTHLIMQRLAEGGRLVEVAPTNWVYTMDRASREITLKKSEYMKYLEENYYVRAVIEAPEGAYDQRATGVSSLLVVVDKMKAPADAQPAIKAYADLRPKNWDEYIKIVEMLERDYKRPQEAIDNATRELARVTQSEPVRPTTGPDATGLVDPAARAGEPTGDPRDIGRPAPQPEPGTSKPAGTTGEPGARQPSLAGFEPAREPRPAAPQQPTLAGFGEPVPGALGEGPTTPDTGRPIGPGGVERGDVGLPPEQPGLGPLQAPNVGEPGGAPGDRGPGMVQRESPIARGTSAPDIVEYSEEFKQSVESSKSAVSKSPSFTVYDGRSPLRESDHYHPHPTAVVETKALAGVPYPELLDAHRPSEWVMGALRRRVISVEGNLDPVWAAKQQNDLNRSGILIADDVGMGKSRTAAAFVLDRIQAGKKRILVMTSGKQNVDNLMNREFPGVYAGKTDEWGSWLDIPNDYPAERVWVSTSTMAPDSKEGTIPTFDGPAVYFLAHHELIKFTDQIKALNPDVVIVDEAHEYASIGTSQRSAAWYDVHKELLANRADFMYLTATPGTDLSELQYLHGLRLWSLDGFSDWIKVITGEVSPEQAKKQQENRQKLDTYMEGVTKLLDAIPTKIVKKQTYELYGTNNYKETMVTKVGDYYVWKSTRDKTKWYVSDWMTDGNITNGKSEQEAIIVANFMNQGHRAKKPTK